MRALWFLLLAIVLTTLLSVSALLAQVPARYEVIVNPDNPAEEVDRRFVSDAFLKKVSVWPSGQMIRPVDLPSGSRTRQFFTDEVLKRSVDAVKRYWQQHIFAGHDLPPPEVDGDDEAVAYVVKHPGAIGYVSPRTDLRGAKVVALR